MGRSQRHLREVQGVDSSGDNSGVSEHDPKNATLPAITGTAQNGQTLTGSLGTWQGPAPITLARQWLRNTTPIAGATNATYVVQPADVGNVIRLRVTASNYAGSVVATSNPTATVT